MIVSLNPAYALLIALSIFSTQEVNFESTISGSIRKSSEASEILASDKYALQSMRWSWPSSGKRVARAFDRPEFPWQSGHRGVDLDLPIGTEVTSVESGTVIYAGILVDRNVISIEHSDGLRSTFEPVLPHVKVGDKVTTGTVLGTVLPGHSPGTLHWGAKWGSTDYVDPLGMVTGPVVLKPWTSI